METLKLIYWSRVGLGIGAALLCVLLYISTGGFTSFFDNLSVALLVYIFTYYVYKWRFIAFVNKPSKILTTGIGAYFLTWIVTLGLLYTLWLWLIESV